VRHRGKSDSDPRTGPEDIASPLIQELKELGLGNMVGIHVPHVHQLQTNQSIACGEPEPNSKFEARQIENALESSEYCKWYSRKPSSKMGKSVRDILYGHV
jgi:hypothetical protein